MDIWQKYKEERENALNKRFKKRAIARKNKAIKTKCDNCGNFPAYPYEDEGHFDIAMLRFKANLCITCTTKLEKDTQ